VQANRAALLRLAVTEGTFIKRSEVVKYLTFNLGNFAPLRYADHFPGLRFDVVFRHACKLGLEGIVSKRKGSPYRSGRSPDWLKMKNPDAPAVNREAEEEWG
jgi:hypothetical protein